jgi:acylphosphatase
MSLCRKFWVEGRVQGVWFRESTRRQADQLGISGHAINLADGRVEVLACGDVAELEELAAWLEQGPQMAQVTAVTSELVQTRPSSGFITG